MNISGQKGRVQGGVAFLKKYCYFLHLAYKLGGLQPWMGRLVRFLVMGVALFLLMGGFATAQIMQRTVDQKDGGMIMDMKIRSPAFQDGAEIPVKYTFQGGDLARGIDVSPPLVWENVPPQAESLVLIVEDPDAPDPAAPERTWTHWMVCDMPAALKGLPEGVASFPKGTWQGLNDSGQAAYGGPHPPVGRHRYYFRLFALDVRQLILPKKPPRRKDVDEAMWGHILAEAKIMGTYQLKTKQK
jgi:Raf kinase inhibitor-like YbhB/YbcL family protein